MQLIKFCEREKSAWWPLTERAVLRYIGLNEGHEKSKLIGKNLISALKFFKFVMGADFNLEAVLSPLVTGRVSRIVGDREPRVQARPLTLEELQALENKVYDLPNAVDRYMVGCILYAVYARCRWSDLHSIHSIEFDVIDTKDGKFGFVEVRSRAHKTGGTEEKKALFMPFVAPIAGVTTRPWAMAWKEAMESLGFCLWRRPYGAICRAPSASGTFGVRPVTTAEITNMLNGFLGHKVGSPLRTTSHSLKDTLLAWSARYGIEENARTLLGHHSLQGSSMACYSRDLMTGPTRLLSAMILNIRLGNFLPDATRSGWMLMKELSVETLKFSPASLRPGGATLYYNQNVPISTLRFMGRWTVEKSLEHYIQLAMATQIMNKLDSRPIARLKKVGYLCIAQVLSAMCENLVRPIPGKSATAKQLVEWCDAYASLA